MHDTKCFPLWPCKQREQAEQVEEHAILVVSQLVLVHSASASPSVDGRLRCSAHSASRRERTEDSLENPSTQSYAESHQQSAGAGANA